MINFYCIKRATKLLKLNAKRLGNRKFLQKYYFILAQLPSLVLSLEAQYPTKLNIMSMFWTVASSQLNWTRLDCNWSRGIFSQKPLTFFWPTLFWTYWYCLKGCKARKRSWNDKGNGCYLGMLAKEAHTTVILAPY